VFRSIFTRGLFYWLRAPRNNADIRLDEWILAVARLLLSACYLSALIRAESTSMLKVYVLLYLVYSTLIILVLRVYPRLSPIVYIEFHCADILWATQLIVLGDWPSMSYVVFFFVMAGSAIRWGFWEALSTAVVLGITLPLGSYAFNTGIAQLWPYRTTSEFLPDGLFFLDIVFLFGFLAELKAMRSEGHFLARTIEGIRLKSGLDEAFRVVCTQALELFSPAQVLLATHDRKSNRSRLYRLANPDAVFQSVELDVSQREQYLFPSPAQCWRLAIDRPYRKNRFECVMLEAGKIKKEKTGCGVPDSFLTAHPCSLILAVSHVFENDLAIRFYMLDPKSYFGGVAGLRFAEQLLNQVAPVIYDIFLSEQMTIEAKATTSGQLARELHDGVLQSLSIINMQLGELRRQAEPHFAQTAERLESIQHSIQEEIIGLRDFTQKLRSLEVDSSRLIGFLSGMATKFQFEHGITASFVSDIDEVPLRPQVCVELVRIVQEALANVRKHSQAKEVVVYLGKQEGDWMLRIMDNGRGFGFTGVRSHEELQASGKGPIILMERAQAIGGKVCVRSTEGDGSLVEVTFPHEKSF
jgi:signal transduction histidine kinase